MTAPAFEYGPNPSAAGQPGADYLLAPPDPATRVGALLPEDGPRAPDDSTGSRTGPDREPP